MVSVWIQGLIIWRNVDHSDWVFKIFQPIRILGTSVILVRRKRDQRHLTCFCCWLLPRVEQTSFALLARRLLRRVAPVEGATGGALAGEQAPAGEASNRGAPIGSLRLTIWQKKAFGARCVCVRWKDLVKMCSDHVCERERVWVLVCAEDWLYW